MKILVCFPFSAAERGTLDAVARRHGGHEVVHVDSPGEAGQPLANVTDKKAGF